MRVQYIYVMCTRSAFDYILYVTFWHPASCSQPDELVCNSRQTYYTEQQQENNHTNRASIDWLHFLGAKLSCVRVRSDPNSHHDHQHIYNNSQVITRRVFRGVRTRAEICVYAMDVERRSIYRCDNYARSTAESCNLQTSTTDALMLYAPHQPHKLDPLN